jgi:dienelactone hydrolase
MKNMKIYLDRKMILFFSLLIFLCTTPVFASELETELVKIPVKVGNNEYFLDAKIYKPEGNGPFPLIILTHGTPRLAKERAQTDADTYFKRQSEYFANLGYVVTFVVRRGFGSSQAPYAETPSFSDGTKNYYQAGLEAAHDLQAAISYMKEKPYINKNQIILMGQSTGGHSVIATGSLNIGGVIGIVNFAGGRGSYAPDLVRDEKNLVASMGKYGKTSRVPTLWFYAANDHYFSPSVAQAMFAAYTANGGQAEFIALPAYGEDGHRSFVGNRVVWEPYVLQFLEKLKGNIDN